MTEKTTRGESLEVDTHPRLSAEYKKLKSEFLLEQLDDKQAREEMLRRVQAELYRPILIQLEKAKLKKTEVPGLRKLGDDVRAFERLLFVELRHIGTEGISHRPEDAGEVWHLFTRIEEQAKKVALEVPTAIAKKAEAQESTPSKKGDTDEVTVTPRAIPSKRDEEVLRDITPKKPSREADEVAVDVPPTPDTAPSDTTERAPLVEPTPSPEFSYDTYKQHLEAVSKSVTESIDAAKGKINPASLVGIANRYVKNFVPLAQKLAGNEAGSIGSLRDLIQSGARAEDIANAKEALDDEIRTFIALAHGIIDELTQLSNLSKPYTPTEVTLKNPDRFTERKAYREQFEGVKNLDAEVNEKTGEHPLKKQGTVIQSLDDYYQNGLVRRTGAQLRSMLGINPKELPADIAKAREEAEVATSAYMARLEADYAKRIDARVTSGALTPERREELMAKFRVMLANRFVTKHLDRVVTAERGILPPEKQGTFSKVVGFIGRSKTARIAIGSGALVGMTFLTSGVAAAASAPILARVGWKSVFIGTGAGAALGATFAGVASTEGRRRLQVATETAQATASSQNRLDLIKERREAMQQIARARTGGYVVAGAVGGSMAGILDSVPGVSLPDTPDTPETPTVPTPEAPAEVVPVPVPKPDVVPDEVPTIPEDTGLSGIHTVEKGEHIWGISEDHFREELDQLPDEHTKDVVLMAVRERLSADNAKLLHEVGGTGDHADIIHIGDRINIEKLGAIVREEIARAAGGGESVPVTPAPTPTEIPQENTPSGVSTLLSTEKPSTNVEDLRSPEAIARDDAFFEGRLPDENESLAPGKGNLGGPAFADGKTDRDLSLPPITDTTLVGSGTDGVIEIKDIPSPTKSGFGASQESVDVLRANAEGAISPLTSPLAETSVLDGDNERSTLATAGAGAAGAVVATAGVRSLASEGAPQSSLLGESLPQNEVRTTPVPLAEVAKEKKKILAKLDGSGLFDFFTTRKGVYSTLENMTLGDIEDAFLAKRRGDGITRREYNRTIDGYGIDRESFESWMNNIERWKTIAPFSRTKTFSQYLDEVATYLIVNNQRV